MHFMIAMESMRCWMCARIAVPTPIAPMISVIRLTRLRNVVARLRACVTMGCDSRKSAMSASGKAALRRVRVCSMSGELGDKPEQEALGGAAAGQDQTGAFQPVASDHHARTHVEAAQHAIRLVGHLADDAERLPAETNRIAHLQIQSQQHFVGNRDRIRGQGARERSGRRQTNLAIERIFLRIHGLHRHQHGRFRLARGRHGDCFGDPGSVDAGFRQSVHRSGLLRRGQLEGAQRQVGRHQRARLAQEHVVKRAAESAHAGQRSDADRDGENHEQKFERGRARFAPGDLAGCGPGKIHDRSFMTLVRHSRSARRAA